MPIGHDAAPGSGAFAIVYTVRNEAALLPASIAYHAAAGCARFYVFWDGTTDDAPMLLRGRDDVVAQDSVTPDRLTGAGALRIDPARWAEDSRVRQRVNAAHAAMLAAADGIEWLLSIDPDELVVANVGAPADGNVSRIDTMLAAVADEVDQVLVPNLEVVASGGDTLFPFAERTVFHARRPRARAAWRGIRLALLRMVRSHRLAAWFDHGFWKVVSLGRSPRTMRDPWTGRIVPRGHHLGYHSYKAFIRTARAHRFDFAVHRWLGSTGGKPRTVRAGLVLHYDLVSADALARKFRQRQPRPNDPFSVRALLWRVATTLDDDAIRTFFDRNIAVSKAEMARQVRAGSMVEIKGPAAFFRRQPLAGSDRR